MVQTLSINIFADINYMKNFFWFKILGFIIFSANISQAQVRKGLSIEITPFSYDFVEGQSAYDNEYNWDNAKVRASASLLIRYSNFLQNQQNWSLAFGVAGNTQWLDKYNIQYDSEFDGNGEYVRDSTLFHDLSRSNYNGCFMIGGDYGKFFGKNNNGVRISIGMLGFIKYNSISRSIFSDEAVYIDGILRNVFIGESFESSESHPNVRDFSLHIPIKLEYHLRLLKRFRVYAGLRSHIKAITFIKNLDLSNRLLSMGITLGAAYDW